MAQFHALGLLDQVRDPLLRLPDKENDRQGHATLPARAERGAAKRIEGGLLIRIRENSAVVFGPHVGLDTFTVPRSPFVNVLPCLIRTDKGYAPDYWIVANI